MADRVINVLIEVLGAEAAADFSPDDIDLLAHQGYQSKSSLYTATREGLRHLPEARIDAIMTARSATGEILTYVWPCGPCHAMWLKRDVHTLS
jgi:hypothetical protein